MNTLIFSLSLGGIALLFHRLSKKSSVPNGKGFVLENSVTHSRYLPKESAHSFTYPTVSLLLSLQDLENNKLDCGFGRRAFGYGSLARLCGIRSQPYLTGLSVNHPQKDPSSMSIREKLDLVLLDRGWDVSGVEDVWLATMPSFVGFEGINPLSVYYLYRKVSEDEGPRLWIVVLEVHNTFDEKHIYVLETHVHEDQNRQTGFDHQWTFPRQFHVSPFNDRSGDYRCSITSPVAPSICHLSSTSPRPVVKLQMLTAEQPNPNLKLTAMIRAQTSRPLTTESLLTALAKAPFALLFTFPRIAYQAFLLHYRKRLDVYGRPEPMAMDGSIERQMENPDNPPAGPIPDVTGAISWQSEGYLELWARRRVERFLQDRAESTGVSITLTPLMGSVPSKTFLPSPHSPPPKPDKLVIYYRSHRFFTILVTSPTPMHALLLGSDAERLFSPNSRELFLNVFNTAPTGRSPSILVRTTNYIRNKLVPHATQQEYPIPIPVQHPLDDPPSLAVLFFVVMIYVVEHLERRIFSALGARFVPGGEPWNGWGRLKYRTPVMEVGSFRREIDI